MILKKCFKIGRYLIVGSIGAATNVLILYFFTSIVGWWYIASSILAFTLSFIVSFTLQKFWTFVNFETERIHIQVGLYIILALINLGLNTLLLYIFVDHLHVPYVLGQLLTSALVACESFFAYQYFVFKQVPDQTHE